MKQKRSEDFVVMMTFLLLVGVFIGGALGMSVATEQRNHEFKVACLDQGGSPVKHDRDWECER